MLLNAFCGAANRIAGHVVRRPEDEKLVAALAPEERRPPIAGG
jgi:hypothetical protein